NQLAHLRRITALEELRTLAVSRVYLDNFDHLTAYWVSMGLPLATVSLDYGVDDLHGTVQEEKVFHMAGAQTPLALTVERLVQAIRAAGREPAQRGTVYQEIG
ncbi:MAG: aminofutalosine synthase MqnE, partial [Verrucomicrobiales bacterium]|nr:aminofutalosine synthase MqnE [Verrucomicrobiales bacterium]